MMPCAWGVTNDFVDCGYGPGDRMVRGAHFCEIHAEGVEDDEGIDVSMILLAVRNHEATA